ncbi:hypothetical protein HFP15_22225 [Amycolatopsis sp. K13G38]|uniref:Uncharacterized protein n=1 Tax=Amycolatopsis acididurans TaxID=2724524 RepID=A0ABX1J7G6_9PSEU|nr:hypothetical protein [Amycolatopsis acididurans]NKQ55604.1 hypothetical protein [Amycolatopsis acididurans]
MSLFRRHRESSSVALADVLRLVADAERPLSGPAAVALAEQVQEAIGEASGARRVDDTVLTLMIPVGQACETLKLGGWRHESAEQARPQECRRAVERFEGELAAVRVALLAHDPAADDDSHPAVTALYVELASRRRALQPDADDPIAATRALVARCRQSPVETEPAGFGALVTRVTEAGDRLTAAWPTTPVRPSLDMYLTFADAVQAFECVVEQVRGELVALHPRLHAWPARLAAPADR